MARQLKIKTWLGKLNEPERSKALKNISPGYANELVDDLKDAVLSGFLWSKTPEGFNYWSDIYGELINHKYVFKRTKKVSK